MKDVNEVALAVLKLMGIYPIIDRLMDISSSIIDGEYGPTYDDEGNLIGGVCYSSISLVSEGVLSKLLDRHLSGPNLDFFKKVSEGNLDLRVERSTWGNITLTLVLDVPTNPNSTKVEETFPLEIEIHSSGDDFIVKGRMFEDDADAHKKYLTFYSLMA
nr:hypothetical protein [Yoonia sp.]